MPTIESVVADTDLAVKDMMLALDIMHEFHVNGMTWAVMKYGLDKEAAAEAMRISFEKWNERGPQPTEYVQKLECPFPPCTDLDEKRLERDGEPITVRFTALKNRGPCEWSIEGAESWEPSELRSLFGNIVSYYQWVEQSQEADESEME